MATVKKLARFGLRGLRLEPAFEALFRSALNQDGWFESVRRQAAIDRHGAPIPWWTYSCIDFLQPLLQKRLRVFEYGSGNSTLWLARHVSSVLSIENKKAWYDQVCHALPDNVELRHVSLGAKNHYADSVLENNRLYHLIVVDGRERDRCVRNSVSRLTDCGVLLLDDTERSEYRLIRESLVENGFKALDFWGMRPITASKSCTTLLYRQQNVLGL